MVFQISCILRMLKVQLALWMIHIKIGVVQESCYMSFQNNFARREKIFWFWTQDLNDDIIFASYRLE
jgi:hypothetical protein